MVKAIKMPRSMSDSQKLNLDTFRRLINSYGQEIIFETASRCPCYNLDSGQPNFRCPVCVKYGSDSKGWLYKIQRFYIITERSNDDGCLPKFNGEPFIYVRNDNIINVSYAKNLTTGEEYNIVGVSGNKIEISGIKNPKLLDITEVKYEFDSQQQTIGEPAIIDGSWVVKVSSGTIIDVLKVENVTQSEVYTVKDFGNDYIVIEGENRPLITDTILIDYNFISPITGLITGVEPNLQMTAVGEVLLGSAMLTLEPVYKIGYQDRLTLLKQEEKFSEILVKNENDRLLYREIIQIIEVISLGEDGETVVEHIEGTDFVLQGQDIYWLGGGNIPIQGRQYTVTYYHRPYYRVYLSLPLTRTPSNEMMPRRAVIRRDDVW